MSDDKTKTQWHPPFCAATKLELRDNKDDLTFTAEHVLNSKPIQIDLLVIWKSGSGEIKNEIGKIFKGHNIFEYKSPGDSLSIDEYFKVLAYACLYKTNGRNENEIDANDITITLTREAKPVKLFQWFSKQGSNIEKKYRGIYYITGNMLFKTQVIVSAELNEKEHVWLRALTRKMDAETGRLLFDAATSLKDKDDRDNAGSVLQLAISENKAIFDKVREVDDMTCPALMDLMKPEVDAVANEAREEGKKEGRLEGIMEGQMKILFTMVSEKVISEQRAAELAGMSGADFRAAYLAAGLQ